MSSIKVRTVRKESYPRRDRSTKALKDVRSGEIEEGGSRTWETYWVIVSSVLEWVRVDDENLIGCEKLLTNKQPMDP